MVGGGQIPEIEESKESDLSENSGGSGSKKSGIAGKEDIIKDENQKSGFVPGGVGPCLPTQHPPKKRTGPMNYNLKSSLYKSKMVSQASISTVS